MRERLDKTAQSPRAWTLRGQSDRVERAERPGAEQRHRRGRGESDARGASRRHNERGAALEPLGERRPRHESGDVLGIHGGSVGGVHWRRCDLVRRNRPVEAGDRRGRRSGLYPCQEINAFARVSSMPRESSTQARIEIRAAAQNHVALQQRIGYTINIQSAAKFQGREVRIVMANAPFEIPTELRDFAERSVDQARKAFEGFVSVAQKAAGTVDGAAATAQNSAKSVGSQVFGFAEQNLNAAFDLAHKLVQAKDPQEAFALQSEFLKSQIASLEAQAKEIGVLIQKSATPGAK